jgi:hypothetical protein
MVDKTLDQIAALLEATRQEAYAAGFNDALKQIVSAASAMPKGGLPAPREDDEHAGDEPTATGRKRAPRGQVEEQVTRALDGEHLGLTIREIEERSEASGAAVKQSSIRVALLRLEQAGKALREGRRWRLGPADQDEPVADPVPAPSDEPMDASPSLGSVDPSPPLD